MITFKCSGCGKVTQATDTAAGRRVLCQHCRHLNVCPAVDPVPEAADAPVIRPSQGRSAAWSSMAMLVVSAAAWIGWSVLDRGPVESSTPARTPHEALQAELLKQNLGKAGDRDLGARYNEIATRHFGGALAPMPVRWEPGLARASALAARRFTLEGMYGRLGGQSVILLNPDLAADDKALARALCHEMVHAYLYAIGDSATEHGPAFQNLLQRLANEGAFEGISASAEDRARLRGWLDAESARLDAERQAMDQIGAEIDRERRDIEQAMSDLNGAKPTADELSSLATRRDAFNSRIIDVNTRLERNRADLEQFNREVERYNLMLVYPDGVDESALVKPK